MLTQFQSLSGVSVIRYKEFSIQEVFDAKASGSPLPGVPLRKLKSVRLELFFTKGVTCVNCGLEANVFVLETHDKSVKPHLNLYYKGVDDYVLFTKDHIFPKSKGGANELSNYQTMCFTCNVAKADKISE